MSDGLLLAALSNDWRCGALCEVREAAPVAPASYAVHRHFDAGRVRGDICGLETAFRSHHTWTTLEAIRCDGTVSMHTTNVRELKKNPSRALRLAKDGPVLILKGNEPDALLIHLDKSLTETESGVRPALAASLYGSGGVSLGKAAKISGLSLSEFVDHLGNLGIEIVRRDETTNNEAGDVSAWLAS